jgi:hypothetical protein
VCCENDSGRYDRIKDEHSELLLSFGTTSNPREFLLLPFSPANEFPAGQSEQSVGNYNTPGKVPTRRTHGIAGHAIHEARTNAGAPQVTTARTPKVRNDDDLWAAVHENRARQLTGAVPDGHTNDGIQDHFTRL